MYCRCRQQGLHLASLLLGVLTLLQLQRLAYADVYIVTSAYILDPLPDIPADFGPDIPDSGIEGILRAADPEDACAPFTFSDFDTPWIALIARQQQLRATNCTFDVKVMNAQAAGAIAAIVYDDVYESLIIMSKPKGHPDPAIPAVFVSQKAGIIMHKLMTLEPITVRITPLSSVAWLSMLMSAFLGLLALGVVLATFYVMRSWSMWITGMHVRGGAGNAVAAGAQAGGGQGQAGAGRPTAGGQQDPGLPADALRLLPVLVFDPQAASSRASRRVSGAPSGTASLASSLPGSQPRLGMTAWAAAEESAGEVGEQEEGEAEEMLPLLSAGDVEEGFGGGCPLEGEEEGEELASRSSSESGAIAVAATSGRPRPPGAHAGETKRVCAICLESYQEGDKVRVLPCTHRFHMGCVDQWLGGRRFCPVCKHDASKPLPHPEGAAAGGGGGAGGRGGGGLSGASGWTLLFNGLVDLLRRPRVVVSAPRPGAAAPQQPRNRGRRHHQPHQQAQQQRTEQAPELQEPLLSRGGAPPETPQQLQQQPRDHVAAAAAPAGDVEAPGPSRTASSGAAQAAAAAPADAAGASGSATTAPIPIPSAGAGATTAADTARVTEAAHQQPQQQPQTQQQQPQQQQQQQVTVAAPSGGNAGPAARVRAMLAGLLGSSSRLATAPGSAQYSSTL